MAYCNCTTSPCIPAVGQPLGAGEGFTPLSLAAQWRTVGHMSACPSRTDLQDITGTTSWVTAAAPTVRNLCQSACSGTSLPPLTLPPATRTAARPLTTAGSLPYAGGERPALHLAFVVLLDILPESPGAHPDPGARLGITPTFSTLLSFPLHPSLQAKLAWPAGGRHELGQQLGACAGGWRAQPLRVAVRWVLPHVWSADRIQEDRLLR